MEEEKIASLRKQFSFQRNRRSSDRDSKIVVSHRENTKNFFHNSAKDKNEYKGFENTPINPYSDNFLFSYNINTRADKIKFNSMRESKIAESKRIENLSNRIYSNQNLLNTNSIKKKGSQIRIMAQAESHQNINSPFLSLDPSKSNNRPFSHLNTNRCYSKFLLNEENNESHKEKDEESNEENQEENKINDQLPTDQNQNGK